MTVTADPRSEQSYWDRRYADWWDRPFHGMCQEPADVMALEEARIAATLDAVLKPHHSVLDAACGYGRLAPMICARVRSYVGVDFSAAAIEAARVTAPGNARFVASDLLDFTDGPFDTIVMVGAWSSVVARSPEVLAHLRSLLTQDGRLLVFESGFDLDIRP